MKTTTYLLFLSFLFLSVGCSNSEDIEKEVSKPDKEKPEISTEYDPGNASDIEKDKKIVPASAVDNQHHGDDDIQKSLDGDKGTNYHSPWGDGTEFPVTLEYNFSDVETIDYMVLYPRSDGNNNGWIVKATVYTKTKGAEEYTKFDDFEFKKSSSPKIVRFPDGIQDPKAIKISVTEGVNDFASLGEIEFYKKSGSMAESLSIFEDKAATKLKPGITREDIQAVDNEFIRKMAMAIYDDVYDDFRIGEFKSYPDPNMMAAKNKTSTFGFYDNATGIYTKWGMEMVVFMGDFKGEISLRVVNHKKGFGGTDYVLQPGVNRFKVKTEGLAYLIYQNQNDNTVKANFATGKINGYFDITKHTNADWQELINNAGYSYFDILGEHAMLSFTTEDLRQNTQDIEKLIGLYDKLVDMEQDFMGLYKYDRANKTRAYFRTNVHQDMYMYSTAYHTDYSKGTMGALTNAQTLKASPWGPAHETGHTLQTRPGLKWLGMTEVTNNIMSLYIQTSWGNGARLDVEDMGKYNNRYEKGFNTLLNQRAHAAEGDVFVKLIPFWQLQLYMADVLGEKDFYKDVYEAVRENDNPPTAGAAQVDFVKICSDVARLDLTDFFKAWGFLTPGSFDLDDYGKGNLTVTQSMVDDVESYIQSKGYSKPEAKIEYIHEQDLSAYQGKAAPTPGNATVSGNNVNVNSSKNVAVFQQERDGEIVYTAARPKFSVETFQNGDKIFAVGYDGTRKEVQVN